MKHGLPVFSKDYGLIIIASTAEYNLNI